MFTIYPRMLIAKDWSLLKLASQLEPTDVLRNCFFSPKPTSFQQLNLESWQLLPFIDKQNAPCLLWMANKMGRSPGMHGYLLGTYRLPLNNRCWIFGFLSPTKDICGISTFPKLVFHFQEADMKTSILWHQLTMDFPCEPVWS